MSYLWLFSSILLYKTLNIICQWNFFNIFISFLKLTDNRALLHPTLFLLLFPLFQVFFCIICCGCKLYTCGFCLKNWDLFYIFILYILNKFLLFFVLIKYFIQLEFFLTHKLSLVEIIPTCWWKYILLKKYIYFENSCDTIANWELYIIY